MTYKMARKWRENGVSIGQFTVVFSRVFVFLVGRNTRARGADFQVGGLTRTRKREPTRGFRGHAPPGKFEILFF